MNRSTSVIIGTYGADHWKTTAQRAITSAANQSSPAEIIHVHGKTLAEARNTGAGQATGDLLIFLDADDEIHPDYVGHMRDAAGPNLLLQPATVGIVDGVQQGEPNVIGRTNLALRNYLIIGTAVPRDLFHQVGGFLEWRALEDWCLWIRCFQHGADSIPVPGAVYRIHINPNSRNNPKEGARTYNAIRKHHGLTGKNLIS